jgi:hypothetical protein
MTTAGMIRRTPGLLIAGSAPAGPRKRPAKEDSIMQDTPRQEARSAPMRARLNALIVVRGGAA